MTDKIILYTLEKCSRCELVKMMLDEHNVEYETISDKQTMLDRGFEAVPVLEANGNIIDEYSDILIWLENNGYYSFGVDNDESN